MVHHWTRNAKSFWSRLSSPRLSDSDRIVDIAACLKGATNGSRVLFDQLVGLNEQRGPHREAERIRGRGVAQSRSPLRAVQEQSQIINSAIGRPVPKAPPIISANAESRFASHGISRSYIPLLHRAPTGTRLSPNDERSQKQTSDQGRDGFGIQALARARAM